MRNTFLIAEVAQAHDGSLGIAHSYVDALSETGVSAVKFQVHISDAESSAHEPFRVKFSYQDETRFEYWKRMEFTAEQWSGLKEHCENKGLEFVASPFSQSAVDLLESLGIRTYKIGSGEVTNNLMLEKIAMTRKPIILSSGMSSYGELDEAVLMCRRFGNDLTIMQCTTSYPTPYERVGLNVITELRERYPSAKVGLSDHSGTIYPSLAAATLGADALEFHVVFDRRMFGPDAASSLHIDEVKQLANGVRAIETMLANPVNKNDVSSFTDLKQMFGKSLALRRNLDQGNVIMFDDLEAKKPSGFGIPAVNVGDVIGRKLAHSKRAHEFLTQADLV